MAPILDLLSRENAERYVIEPTKTLITDAVFRRQATTTGPVATVTVIQTQAASGGDNGNQAQTLSGGAIAGIVIGSIAGLLLLIWIFRSCSNMGAPPVKGENPSGAAWYDGVRSEPYPPRRSASRDHRSRSRHSSGGGGGRTREVREYQTAVPVMAQPQPTYVYETDTRKSRRGRSRDHRSRSASRY